MNDDDSSTTASPRELPETRDGRIMYALGIVSRGEWEHGVSARKLAETFGVHIEIAREYHREACRLIRLSMGSDLATARNQLLAETHALYQRAINATTMVVDRSCQEHLHPTPDVKGGVAALRLKSDVMGLTAYQGRGSRAYTETVADAMSSEELAEECRRLAAELEQDGAKSPEVH